MQKRSREHIEPNATINSMNHEVYINLSIQWTRWLLKPIGLWPVSSDTSTIEKFLSHTMKVVCYCVMSFILIPTGLYLVMEEVDVYSKIKFCGPSGFCAIGIMKYQTLILHGKDIRDCVQRIEWNWKHVKHVRDKHVMVSNAVFGRKLLTICTFFMYSGCVIFYMILPGARGLAVPEDLNITFIPHPFPFPRDVIDSRLSPANEIIFVIHLLGGVLIHSIAAGACSLIAAFAVHVSGQMEVLMCWLKHLINGRGDTCDTFDERLVDIVRQHIRILKFLTIIQKSLQHILLVEFVGSTLIMCLLGYYIIMEWNANDMASSITYCLILVSFVFNIFIYCYIGQLVTDQWKMIGRVSYMSDWHQLPGKRKLSFVLIIAMSNLPKRLTAGNMIELSLSTFSSIIKTSFAFFNMLRTLT